MNIFYITMIFPYPSETFASNDVRALWRSGVQVSVHSLRAAHKASSRLLKERNLTSVPVTYNTTTSLTNGLKIGLTRPRLFLDLLTWIVHYNWKKPEHILKSLALAPRALQLFSHIERERPDVVHVYWGHHPSLVGYLVQSYLPQTVVSISLAAYDLEMEYGGSAPVAQRADMVRTLAKVNVEHISKAFGVPDDRITVLYDGVDLSRFQNTSLIENKTEKRIVTAGRLIPSKGTADTLKVFAEVLKRWPEATLVVLGDGPELERLQVLAKSLAIEKAVTFKGHVSHKEVFEEMSQAEIFLFMSKKSSERLPNVVKEAMGCRCLCIVTETPGIEELLVNGEHGYVVAQGDVKSAAQHVHTAFSSSSMVQSMTQSAYQHLADKFDLDRIMAQYRERWEHLVVQKQLGKDIGSQGLTKAQQFKL